METYLPDAETRREMADFARREVKGARASFWRRLPGLPARPANAHKGTFGTALAVGGARGMSGAIALTGASSLVAGSGLTRVLTPDAIADVVAQFQREYTVIPAPNDASGKLRFDALDLILAEAERATAVAVGPGLGRSDELDRLVLELFFELPCPAVFDADALNALASAGLFDPKNGERFADRRARAPRVLTPHPGEFARLFGEKPPQDDAGRRGVALSFAETIEENCAYGALSALVLKGARSVIVGIRPIDVGQRYDEFDAQFNETGNSNLATGGSGDVLTGIILGLLAQGASALKASTLGAALHGLAAELRATICGRGALAGDAIRFLPCAFDVFDRIRAEL